MANNVKSKNQNDKVNNTVNDGRIKFPGTAAKVLMSFISVFFTFGLFGIISYLIRGIKNENGYPNIWSLIIMGAIALSTVFLTVCACTIKQQFTLRLARIVAIASVIFTAIVIIIGFVAEAVFGLFLFNWCGGYLLLLFVYIFYYMMIQGKIKAIAGYNK